MRAAGILQTGNGATVDQRMCGSAYVAVGNAVMKL